MELKIGYLEVKKINRKEGTPKKSVYLLYLEKEAKMSSLNAHKAIMHTGSMEILIQQKAWPHTVYKMPMDIYDINWIRILIWLIKDYIYRYNRPSTDIFWTFPV